MGGKPQWAEDIARERIAILFEEAGEAFPEQTDRADRYVELARDIAQTLTVSIPERFRDRFCTACHAYLQPGENARIRVEDGTRRVTCEECGATHRVPYGEETG
ncbi:MAG: ribonuclease P protein component 4 [Candidatus Nanohaloarchaea archaeon]|nr:ribonuclease P protein component 4 [Candidatus Nanohaloarchaea archaeon]